jgi:hypothetical protein
MKTAALCSLLALVMVTAAVAQPIDAFPPDPQGVTVSDRLYQQFELENASLDLYAVMYPHGSDVLRVDVYSGIRVDEGMEWKKLHAWDVPKGPDTIDVLTAYLYEGTTIQLVSTSWFAYVEGRAVPVLSYNPKLGTFEESLQD